MWSPTVMLTLGAAALTTAAPFNATANTTHGTIEPRDCAVYSNVFPDGVAPVSMALVEDPAAELRKCKIKAFKTCLKGQKYGSKLPFNGCLKYLGKKCKLPKVVAPVVADIIVPAEKKNRTLEACGTEDLDDVPGKIVDIIFGKERNKTEHAAIEPREKSECPKKCAPWAAIFPFGVWFGVCVGDCHLRCARGLSCP